jgi:hypothetical protein
MPNEPRPIRAFIERLRESALALREAHLSIELNRLPESADELRTAAVGPDEADGLCAVAEAITEHHPIGGDIRERLSTALRLYRRLWAGQLMEVPEDRLSELRAVLLDLNRYADLEKCEPPVTMSRERPPAEWCRILDIKGDTLNRWMNDGKLRAERITTKRVKIALADLPDDYDDTKKRY